jgi:hypothetical protein
MVLSDTPAAIYDGGAEFSNAERFTRLPDLADFPGIMNGALIGDGAALVSAFAEASFWTHSEGEIRILSNTTIPKGAVLKINGGTIYRASGVTLTINGELDCPPSFHVFTGPGEVRGLDYAYPEWFGAVGDYDESEVDGGDWTGDAAAWNKASRAARVVKGQDKAYAAEDEILFQPTLQKSCFIEGAGVSLAGAGTRIYVTGGSTFGVNFSGDLGYDDPSSNADYGASNLTIRASVGACPIGLRIAGSGGASNKTLRSLNGGKFTNVVVNEFATNVVAYSFINVSFEGCRFESQSTVGISLDVGVTPGGKIASELNLSRSKLTQPTGGAGVALKLTVSDSGTTDRVELRGVKLDDDTQLYAGTGYCIDGLVIGRPTLTRTMGDIQINPGCALQGDANITSDGAVRFRAQDGGALSSIHINGVQVESSEGPAFSFQTTTTGSTFGTIHTVGIDGCTFRYNEGRSIQLDGVKGFTITNNKLAFCGIDGSSVVEHIWVNNPVSGRIENNLATAKAEGSWPGLATGITIAGSVTDVLTRANSLGVTTPRDGGTDSDDQPSKTVQV